MRRHTGVIIWIVVGVLLAALGFVAGFFLPFWDYSTTYAPIIQPRSSMTPALAVLADALIQAVRL